jgi:hypothetical protein
MATNQKKNTKEQAVAQSLKVLTTKVSDQQRICNSLLFRKGW